MIFYNFFQNFNGINEELFILYTFRLIEKETAMRNPSDIPREEKERIRKLVHKRAEEIGWHKLNNKQKAKYYDEWSREFNIGRAYLKDRIMKGFDVSQGIPLKNEAAIQKEIEKILEENGISKLSQYTLRGKYRVDLVIGFYEQFPTHVIEIERADKWLEGFTQILGYAADYFDEHQKLIQPILIIYGSVSAQKIEKIQSTCNYSKVVLCAYKLNIKGTTRAQILNLEEYFGLHIKNDN